jgi:hypothetical protein
VEQRSTSKEGEGPKSADERETGKGPESAEKKEGPLTQEVSTPELRSTKPGKKVDETRTRGFQATLADIPNFCEMDKILVIDVEEVK